VKAKLSGHFKVVLTKGHNREIIDDTVNRHTKNPTIFNSRGDLKCLGVIAIDRQANWTIAFAQDIYVNAPHGI
jgi:hypothetical protein